MDTQHLSTYLSIDCRHALARAEEILSDLLPERVAQVNVGDLCRSLLENVPEHRAMCTASGQAEGTA